MKKGKEKLHLGQGNKHRRGNIKGMKKGEEEINLGGEVNMDGEILRDWKILID